MLNERSSLKDGHKSLRMLAGQAEDAAARPAGRSNP